MVAKRGHGVRVEDVDGNEFLDFAAGIAVTSTGHCHPEVVAAIQKQAAELIHMSGTDFYYESLITLSERLSSIAPMPGPHRFYYGNSGAEAIECALKIARYHTGRQNIIAFFGAFHGRTMGALSLTGKSSIREPFGPFGLEVRFVPYGDSAALRDAVGSDCAAVFLEPCQGEAGVVPAPEGYLRDARAACDEAGALLVVDEIQSGMGRTGAWYAHQREGIVPDVVTLAKGLGGGLPIGACIGIGDCGAALGKGDHGSTFAGNPVACAAALAVLDTIERDGLLGNAIEVGNRIAAGVEATGHPLVTGVRGTGLWRAITLAAPAAAAVEAAARRAGFLVNAVQPDAIRLAPPLILTAEQADSFTAELPSILSSASVLAGQVA
jgi:acetylornithine aminotransferase